MENPRDRGAQWAAIYGVAQSQAQLKQRSSSSSIHIKLVGMQNGEQQADSKSHTATVEFGQVINLTGTLFSSLLRNIEIINLYVCACSVMSNSL